MCWECGAVEKLEKVEDDDEVEGRCPNCGREFDAVDWGKEVENMSKFKDTMECARVLKEEVQSL